MTTQIITYKILVKSLFCLRWFLKSGTRLWAYLLSAILVHYTNAISYRQIFLPYWFKFKLLIKSLRNFQRNVASAIIALRQESFTQEFL